MLLYEVFSPITEKLLTSINFFGIMKKNYQRVIK